MAPKGIAASYPLLVINLPGTADVPLADKQVEITVATQGRLARDRPALPVRGL